MKRKCKICGNAVEGEPGVWCMRCCRAWNDHVFGRTPPADDNRVAPILASVAEWASNRARKAERRRNAWMKG